MESSSKPLPKYRVAVLGCGLRGPHHAINFLVNRDRFDLVSVCDQDTERLDKCMDRLAGDPWKAAGIARYEDAETMLDETRPDVFCFATRPNIRLSLIELGLKYGPKAICYEKPMALSLKEGWAIARRLEETGTKATIAHIHKYGSYFRKVRSLIDEGKIGEIESVHATCSGWFTGMATHMIDSMIYLMGGKARVSEVIGFGAGTRHAGNLGSNASPDYTVAQLEFDNGIRGYLDCGDRAPEFPPGDMGRWPNTGVTVRGSRGWVQAILGSGWRAASSVEPSLRGSDEVVFDQIHDGDPYIADLAKWLDDDQAVHPCGNEMSWHTFEAMMACYLSLAEKRSIALPLSEAQKQIDVSQRLSAALAPGQ